MAEIFEDVGDLLVFVSGVIFLFIAIVFLQLYYRYKRRDYFLLSMGFFAAFLATAVEEIDVIIPEGVTTEFLEFLSEIFTFIMVIFILIVLVFPDKVPIDFERSIEESVDEE